MTLGWRVWMFGQFILLIWAVDIGQEFLQMHTFKTYLMSKSDFAIMKRGRSLAQLLIVGIATSIFSLTLLRFFPIMIDMGITGVPNALSPDTQFGLRSFAARQSYEFIRDSLPKNVIIQYNPNAFVDRPSGLYGTRQMVISDHSSYGLPLKVFKDMQAGVGAIFTDSKNDWQEIDQICRHYLIDVILISDQDPIWQTVPILREKRQSLYINSYYAIFSCGDFIKR